MKNFRVRDTSDHISERGLTESTTSLVPRGSVLLVVRSGILRRTLPVAIAECEVALNQDLKAIVPYEEVKADYLGYWIWAHQGPLLAEWRKEGTTVESLESDLIKNTWITLPPRSEQRAIGRFLDDRTAQIDRLIDKKERLIELLEERRTALITKAVTKGLDPDVPTKDSGVEWLGEIPEHWDMVSLRNLSPNITVGIVVKPTDHYAPEGVPCLRSQNVKLAEISRENLVFIDRAANRELEKSQIHSGDLVTVRTGDPGTTAVVPPDLDGANCVDLVIIREPELADQRWLCWFMNSEAANVQYRIWSGGAAQQHLNVGAVKQVRVPVPPIDEQRAIGEHTDQHNRHFKQVREKLIKAIELLQEYRSALITAAVTGRIDVRDYAA